ncbi:Translation initiation factor 1A [Fusarium chlamydosporum]
MPKNKGKGGKNRRRGTKENDDQRRELTFKEDGQEYAQVIKMLGNGRLEALCFDGSKRLANVSNPRYLRPAKMLCNRIMAGGLSLQYITNPLFQIRGKMRKKVWINQGDIILLSLRDFQDNKGDVILKYTADEARTLKSYGELPENAKINETDSFGQGEDGEAYFEFGDADSDEESDDGAANKKEVDIDDI